MNENVLAKLKILAESAKYDVSCSSSGTVRSNKPGMLGNTVGGWGICHSFAEDGRCISLLKIMLTNYCIYDCAYCVNRRSNDLPRATFSVSELVELTMEFYRRNYIEGLFLSSGVVRNPDYTMERLVRVAKDLRLVHRFNGYIHLKSIPGASRELVNEAGLYADRLSVNVEIPKEENLKLLAPEKDHKSVFAPMKYIQQGVLESKEERQTHSDRTLPGLTSPIRSAMRETAISSLSLKHRLTCYHSSAFIRRTGRQEAILPWAAFLAKPLTVFFLSARTPKKCSSALTATPQEAKPVPDWHSPFPARSPSFALSRQGKTGTMFSVSKGTFRAANS